MKKKLLAAVLAITLAVMPMLSVSASAKSGGLGDYITVTGYDPDVDYMTMMLRALKDGSAYAMQVGAIYEQQRNLKIEKLNMRAAPGYPTGCSGWWAAWC